MRKLLKKAKMGAKNKKKFTLEDRVNAYRASSDYVPIKHKPEAEVCGVTGKRHPAVPILHIKSIPYTGWICREAAELLLFENLSLPQIRAVLSRKVPHARKKKSPPPISNDMEKPTRPARGARASILRRKLRTSS